MLHTPATYSRQQTHVAHITHTCYVLSTDTCSTCYTPVRYCQQTHVAHVTHTC